MTGKAGGAQLSMQTLSMSATRTVGLRSRRLARAESEGRKQVTVAWAGAGAAAGAGVVAGGRAAQDAAARGARDTDGRAGGERLQK